MSLTYAVERLLDTGWSETQVRRTDRERLPDWRPYPTVDAVRREFAGSGLELSLKHNPTFKCCRATWGPAADRAEADHAEDARHGTVVGSCEKEAAVYALAQLRAATGDRQFATL